MSPSKLDSTASFGIGDASVLCSQPENGFGNSHPLIQSEKAVQELLQQTPIQGTDEHLIEFSEALRTVAKALRQAAEGKAVAQAEASEWKRRYELERARNLQMERKGNVICEILKSWWTQTSLYNAVGLIRFILPCLACWENWKEQNRQLSEERSLGNSNGHCEGGRFENSTNNLVNCNQSEEHSRIGSLEHGICSHEVLQNAESDFDSDAIHSKMMRKASFKLSWRSKGENSDQHKQDIVYFERGNITTAERSSKQITLKWESQPQTLFILTKPNSTSVRILCAEMIRWLREQRKVNIYVEPRVKAELLVESADLNYVQTWKDALRPINGWARLYSLL